MKIESVYGTLAHTDRPGGSWHGPRSRAPGAVAVRVQHLVPHPVPGVHHRARGLDRRAGGALAEERQHGPRQSVPLLDQDLRRVVRHGRGVRHRHVVPVRHQLERALEPRRQRARPAPPLRGAERVLPRGVVPRHPAVRPRSGTALGALRRRLRRGGGHADLRVLDPRRQQLDADADRLRAARGHVPRHQLVAGGVQSLVPVPVRAHGHGGVFDHRVRGRRGERLASVEPACGAARRGRPVHGARPDHGARAGAADPRRSARAEHVRAPARQGGGHGRPLGDPRRRAVRAVRPARSGGRDEPLRGRDPEARQPDPHPRARRHGARARRMAARGAAVRADRVLVVSSDGRPRAAHDRGGGAQPLAAPWRPDLSDALVPQAVHRA